jgi:hypothetical protein
MIYYMPSFVKDDADVQVILRFFLRNLRGCNVGIADGRDLLIMPLRWGQVPVYAYQIS